METDNLRCNSYHYHLDYQVRKSTTYYLIKIRYKSALASHFIQTCISFHFSQYYPRCIEVVSNNYNNIRPIFDMTEKLLQLVNATAITLEYIISTFIYEFCAYSINLQN